MKKENYFLTITDVQTIEGIQNSFNTIFPFLKIEFFKKSHFRGKSNPKSLMYEYNLKLKEIRNKKFSGKIKIEKNMTVAELESIFENKFGLHAQVFRKSGNVWLETSSTDNWTLEEQNTEGENLQQHLKTEKENPENHDMW